MSTGLTLPSYFYSTILQRGTFRRTLSTKSWKIEMANVIQLMKTKF